MLELLRRDVLDVSVRSRPRTRDSRIVKEDIGVAQLRYDVCMQLARSVVRREIGLESCSFDTQRTQLRDESVRSRLRRVIVHGDRAAEFREFERRRFAYAASRRVGRCERTESLEGIVNLRASCDEREPSSCRAHFRL